MMPPGNAQYVCIPTQYGLFNVVDRTTGRPAEVGVTAILLTRREALRLIASLRGRRSARNTAPGDHLRGKQLGAEIISNPIFHQATAAIPPMVDVQATLSRSTSGENLQLPDRERPSGS